MMYTHDVIGEGGWQAGERWMVTLSTSYAGGGPLVIYVPGVAADGWALAGNLPYRRDLDLLAQAGCVVFSSTFADQAGGDGGASWGNQYGRDTIDLAIAHAASEYDADTSRLAFIGSSEGGVLALNWAWRHPEAVAAVATHLSPVDVQALYDGNAIAKATIDLAFDAYGGWAVNRDDHDPAANYEAIAAIADRVRCYYSTNDGLAPEADHQALAAATGVRIVPIGEVGHDKGMLPFDEEAAWLFSKLAG